MATKPLRLPTAQTSAAASGPRERLSIPPRSTAAPLCGQCTGLLCESVACCPLWVGPRPQNGVEASLCLERAHAPDTRKLRSRQIWISMSKKTDLKPAVDRRADSRSPYTVPRAAAARDAGRCVAPRFGTAGCRRLYEIAPFSMASRAQRNLARRRCADEPIQGAGKGVSPACSATLITSR